VAETGDTNTTIFGARHVTIVDTGGDADPVIEVGDTLAPADGDVNAVINDTIIAGNLDPLSCDSPMSNTTLTLRYSWFFHSAFVNGNCTLNTGTANLDAYDPMVGAPAFADADYRLPAGSRGIDSGDPLTVTLPTEDLNGIPRPLDGNGDGTARRDMGAHEYQPPTPGGAPSLPAAKKKKKKCKRKRKKKAGAAKKKRKCKRKKGKQRR
jgi:hypothetical protein